MLLLRKRKKRKEKKRKEKKRKENQIKLKNNITIRAIMISRTNYTSIIK